MKPFQNFGREDDLAAHNSLGNGNGNGNGHAPERRPGDIEEEIELTRARMASTLEAIKRDLSPGQMVDQVLHSVREGKAHDVAASAFHTVGDIVKANPLPCAVIGVGLVWLAASSKKASASTRDVSASGTSRGIGSDDAELQRELQLQPQDVEGMYSSGDASMSSEAGIEGESERRMQHAKQRVAHMAGAEARRTRFVHGARARVSGAAHGAASKARSVAHTAGAKASSGAVRVRDASVRTYGEQPLVVGAIAVGIGALIGALLPPTSREDQLLGAQRDRVKQRVDDAGAQLLGRAREKIDESAQRLQAKMQQSEANASSAQPSTMSAQSGAAGEPVTPRVPQTDEGDFGGP